MGKGREGDREEERLRETARDGLLEELDHVGEETVGLQRVGNNGLALYKRRCR